MNIRMYNVEFGETILLEKDEEYQKEAEESGEEPMEEDGFGTSSGHSMSNDMGGDMLGDFRGGGSEEPSGPPNEIDNAGFGEPEIEENVDFGSFDEEEVV